MRIVDFANFIREIPYEYQSSDIKKSIWETEISQKGIIERIFDGNEVIRISRFDLFHAAGNLHEFAVKVLMWGYPTKGFGKNIERLLVPEKFNQTIKKLEEFRQKGNISNEDVKVLFSDGLRLSTVSKLLYFLQIKVESFPALILDLRVIDALTRKNGFEDEALVNLKTLNYNNAPGKYPLYLKAVNDLASKMKVQPDQIEMFLFEFGTNLKKPEEED